MRLERISDLLCPPSSNFGATVVTYTRRHHRSIALNTCGSGAEFQQNRVDLKQNFLYLASTKTSFPTLKHCSKPCSALLRVWRDRCDRRRRSLPILVVVGYLSRHFGSRSRHSSNLQYSDCQVLRVGLGTARRRLGTIQLGQSPGCVSFKLPRLRVIQCSSCSCVRQSIH